MIDVFNETNSELGVASEEDIIRQDAQIKETEERPEIKKETTTTNESTADILGIQTIINPSNENIPKTKEIEESAPLKLNKIYRLLAKLPFSPSNIFYLSQEEFLVVGPHEISSVSIDTSDKGKGQIKEILTEKIYLSLFKKEMPVITSSLHQGGTNVLVGFDNGEALQFDGHTFKILPGGPAYTGDSINSIIEHEGKVIIGSKGIYIWEPDLNRFMSSQESKKINITSVHPVNHKLVIFVTPESLITLSFPEKAIKTLFTPLPTEQPILSLVQDGDEFLVGTLRGVVRISNSGSILSRFSSYLEVYKLIKSSNNKFLVLTDKGPGFLENDEIFIDNSLANNQISSITMNQDNKLILGLRTGEIIKAELPTFEKEFKKSPVKDRIKEVFPNACRAHESLLSELSYSHQLSYIFMEPEPYIFINGELVCPNGVGHMNKSGSAIIFQDDTLRLSELKEISKIDLPKDVIENKITHILRSRDKVIYLGTEKGLYVHKEKNWEKPKESQELIEDFISDIIEDHRGNIWVSTRTSSTDSKAPPSGYNPLHIQIGERWSNFGSKNGLRAYGISDLLSSKQDILMSSASGFFVLTPNSEIHAYSRASGLKKYIVESINRDRRGRIWLSSSFFLNGISWIDENKIYTLDESNGLFSNRIAKIGVDEEDRIWIIDSSGKTGVYDYQSLLEMAEVSKFDANRSGKEKFLP